MAKNTMTELPGADLLFGTHSKTAEPVKEDVPEVKKSGPAVGTKASKASGEEPVKFTFYFDPQILEDLEVAKFRLRMEKRIKISKSDIVNSALNYCMKDLSFLERLVSGEVK